MPAQTVIKLRRGTAAEWTSANPVLGAGEMGIEIDTSRSKFGDGATAWTALNYTVGDSSGVGSIEWTSVTNKPTEFPPEAHTHTVSDVTDISTTYAALSGANFSGPVEIQGDLIVGGTTTTVNAQDLVVADPLIYIGENNTGDVLDLGFVASHTNGTYSHTGLARDASDGVWKLFTGVTDEPTTTINFAQGTLADLAVGSLTVDGPAFGGGTAGQYLSSNGASAAPTWKSVPDPISPFLLMGA